MAIDGLDSGKIRVGCGEDDILLTLDDRDMILEPAEAFKLARMLLSAVNKILGARVIIAGNAPAEVREKLGL